MTARFIDYLVEISSALLPNVKRIRPLSYWDFKTNLELCVQYRDHGSARELADFHLQVCTQQIEAATEQGDAQSAAQQAAFRDGILEGMKGDIE
jgi:hypothetical protein